MAVDSEGQNSSVFFFFKPLVLFIYLFIYLFYIVVVFVIH